MRTDEIAKIVPDDERTVSRKSAQRRTMMAGEARTGDNGAAERSQRKTLSVLKSMFDAEAPPHPGEILREDILPRTGLAATDLAAHLDVAPNVVEELLGEKRAVSLDLALRLGAALGQGARYWLGVQAMFDIWQAEQPALVPARVRPVQFTPRVRTAAGGRRAVAR